MQQPNFFPFPKLTTARTLLRRLHETDSNDIYFLRSDPDVLRYVDREPAKSVHDAVLYIQQMNQLVNNNEIIIWGITFPPEDRVIGTVCYWKIERDNYRAEIGYVLHPAFHRQGIMKEVLQTVLAYGFKNMQLHSVVANVNPENMASSKLLNSLDFRQEAYFRENYFFGGKFLDTAVYTLISNNSIS